MTLLAGRSITNSFGSRLILDGADLAIEPRAFLDRVADRIVEVDGSVRASDGGYSASLERKAAAAE